MRARIGLLLLIGHSTLLLGVPTHATHRPTDTAVKAAFLPRFARYVTWPSAARPGPGEPVVLCTLGRDPFGSMLEEAVQSQSVDGHRFVIRRLGDARNVKGCHIAYVGAGSDRPTGQVLASLANQPVLTVTDASSGPQRGIIHFAMVSGRVRFFIDEDAAARRGMSVSSRLLSLAVGVRARK